MNIFMKLGNFYMFLYMFRYLYILMFLNRFYKESSMIFSFWIVSNENFFFKDILLLKVEV